LLYRLSISKLTDESFSEFSSMGKNAPIIFIDSKEFPNSYRLRGQYTIQGNKLSIKTNLFKGKDKIKALDFAGAKDKLPDLIKEITTGVINEIR